jgi:hypothetical protein
VTGLAGADDIFSLGGDIILHVGTVVDDIILLGTDIILLVGAVVESPITELPGADDIILPEGAVVDDTIILYADIILLVGAVVESRRTGAGEGTLTTGLVGAFDRSPTDAVVGTADGTPGTGPVDGMTIGAFVDKGR